VRWEELTYEEIKKLAEEGAIVVLPLGSLEIHGPHLPVGTDYLAIYKAALEAAKREKAVILPPLAYTYVPENRHFPGAISLSGTTMVKVLEEICDEVYRNGFKKILILNGHGGNARVLGLFLREMINKRKEYMVYVIMNPMALIRDVIEKVKETDVYGHAGEIETSIMLYLFPNLVKMERIKGEAKLGRSEVVDFTNTLVDWISYALEGYVGNPTKATASKGEILFNAFVKILTNIIKKIKEDKMYEKILREYYERAGFS